MSAENPGGNGGTGSPDAPAPWLRQPGETGAAFNAFVAFRDSPPGRRQYAKVARMVGNHVKTVERWGTRFGWQARALAWDEYRDQVAREAELDELEQARRRQVSLGTHMQLLAKLGCQELQDPDGRLRKRLKPHEIARLAEVGTKVERTAQGAPTEIVRSTVDVEHAPTPEEEDDLLAPYLADPDVAEQADRLAAAMEEFSRRARGAPVEGGADPVEESAAP